MNPEKNMTKNAGASAESANEKSRLQCSQRGRSARNPWNKRPLPQRGQRPSRPARKGDGGGSEEWVTIYAYFKSTTGEMASEPPKLKSCEAIQCAAG